MLAASSTLAATAAANVHSIAGSGKAGIADGRALSATFIAPEGVAVAADGSIVIADTGAQRIRLLGNGTVSTLAGSGNMEADWDLVPGQPDLGTSVDPHFDSPTGLAYLRDGTLLIADSDHHCIRSLRHGMVESFAGSSVSGTSDGTRAKATFQIPNGLATDDAGDVFVADLEGGLREISGDVVSTIALPAAAGKNAVGVATFGSGGSLRIFVSTYAGLVVVDANHKATLYAGLAEGKRRFGYPAALIALRKDAVAFTDARDSTLRIFRMPVHAGDPPAVEPLPVDVIEDGAFAAAGYADGSLRGARFDVPQGLARASNGDLIVADTGNRRIRRVDGVAARLPFVAGSGQLPAGRTWIVGGPASYYDTIWATSIAGIAASLLPAKGVEALEYDDASAATSGSGDALSLASRSRPATTIWLLTTRDLATLGKSTIARQATAAAARGRLVLVALPLAGEIASRQNFSMLSIDPTFDFAVAEGHYRTLVGTLRPLKIPTLDLGPALSDEVSREDPYATLTPNLSDGGRAAVGRAIAAFVNKS
jgi:hypothetical protein